MRNPILVALDVSGADEALKLAKELQPAVGGFKIGLELFTSAGPEIVKRLRGSGAQVFLDLKLHDIPNTVASAVAAAVRLDVQMLTLHTAGGTEMMKAAERAALAAAAATGTAAPLILGVTVLTSMDANTLRETGCEADPGRQVERLAQLAVKAGLRGLVCSPRELSTLRRVLPPEIQLVTPGIRAGTEPADDQKRTLTPVEAMRAGASWLVIGRPITRAAKPREAAEGIVASLQA